MSYWLAAARRARPPAAGSAPAADPAVDISAQLSRAPAWVVQHAARLESDFGPSAHTATAVRLGVTGLAAITAASYSGYWRQFVAFCVAAGRESLPATSSTCALFVAHLHDRGTVQPESLQPYLSAINRAHRDILGVDPGPAGGTDVNNIIRGWRLERASSAPSAIRDVRAPLPAEVALRALRAAAEMPTIKPGPECFALLRRFRSLLYVGLGFQLMARSDTDIHLQVDDVWLDADSIRIRLQAEKGRRGDPERRVLAIPLNTVGGLLARALRRWLAGAAYFRSHGLVANGDKSFWRAPGDPTTWTSSSSACTAWLAEATAFIEASPPTGQCWTSHSLRKGAATAAHAVAVPVHIISFYGGWQQSSGVVHTYIDLTVTGDVAAAAFFAWMRPRAILAPS